MLLQPQRSHAIGFWLDLDDDDDHDPAGHIGTSSRGGSTQQHGECSAGRSCANDDDAGTASANGGHTGVDDSSFPPPPSSSSSSSPSRVRVELSISYLDRTEALLRAKAMLAEGWTSEMWMATVYFSAWEF